MSTPGRARKLISDTSCDADNIGRILEELMRSLAAMTGNLIGGDTLGGGGGAKDGDRVHSLPLRATGAQRDCVSEDIRRETKRRRRTCLVQNGALFILARRGMMPLVSSPSATMRGA